MATAKINEAAFEEAIEHDLVSIHGYTKGDAGDFDKALGINTKMLFSFLETTQGKELEKLQTLYDWREEIPKLLSEILLDKGSLYLLRNEIHVKGGARLRLFYPTSSKTDSGQAEQLHTKNIWAVTRQQTFSLEKPGLEIDMVLFVNGIPLFTLELKNSWYQKARVDGIQQYRLDRDPNQPLLRFGVCLAHMAVDMDEVWMTSRLEGERTQFIPFNKWSSGGMGAGNPEKDEDQEGFKSDYLWMEVFKPDCLSDIIWNFALMDFGKGKNKQSLNNAKRLIFPRYHQLEAVRKLCKDASEKGVGQRYLIQHSAGSGKSNTITWLAYKLVSLCSDSCKEGDERLLFDTVIVVTDRKALDEQLKRCIESFGRDKKQIIFSHADSAKDLKRSIENAHRIIITTIEKFPYIRDGIASMQQRRFAVIIDEAHSSQGGQYASKMNKTLQGKNQADQSDQSYVQKVSDLVGGDEDCNGGDIDQTIEQIYQNPNLRTNTSFFAFTATPKWQTLQMFGTLGEDGQKHPFHLYSMVQAIDEGFILNVVKNYLSYRCYYKLKNKRAKDPLLDKQYLAKELSLHMLHDEKAISKKALLMVDHFDGEIVKKHLLCGKARAMVVTHDITCAILYYKAIRKLCTERNLGYLPVIAFSGKKKLDGVDYTEGSINDFGENQTTQKFDSEDKFRILVVANKYITGFDQPKLCAMYVDKALSGVQAVQTLSRLNRTASDLGKRTEDLAVIDFFNDTDTIEKAFNSFYSSVSLVREDDPQTIGQLYGEILGFALFTKGDIDAFVEKLYGGADLKTLDGLLNKTVNRFKLLDEERQRMIKVKCTQYLKLYYRITAIVDLNNVELDKMAVFLGKLLPRLPALGYALSEDEKEQIKRLVRSIKVRSKLSKQDGEITLVPTGDDVSTPGSGSGRGQGERQKVSLDELIEEFNKRYAFVWKGNIEQKKAEFQKAATGAKEDAGYQKRVRGNPDERLSGVYFEQLVKQLMKKHISNDSNLREAYFSNAEFKREFNEVLMSFLKDLEDEEDPQKPKGAS